MAYYKGDTVMNGPFVSVNEDGEVHLEWHLDIGITTVDIADDGSAALVSTRRGEKAVVKDFSEASEAVNMAIGLVEGTR